MFFKFWANTRGNVAIVFTLVLPVLLTAAGFSVDYAVWAGQKSKLQGIADATAVAAARELYMANADVSQLTAIATNFANAQPIDHEVYGSLTVTANVLDSVQSQNDPVAAVEVEVTQARTSYFTSMLSGSFSPLAATAVARVLGGGRLCALGLKESGTTIMLTQHALVTATTCSVYSNSTSSSGIDAGMKSSIDAELICSAGGTDGGASNFSPSPTTDCPQIEDPLAARPAPVVGACDYDDTEIKHETTTLYPGVYCGGLSISSNSDVIMEDGIYVIKDGPFSVTSNSTVFGEGVGFYLTGDDAVYNFGSQSDINFSAPIDGPLAGILFFEDRDAPPLRRHVISSKKADNLLGTVYLSRGIFVVATNNKVAQDSAYTAIIANRFELSKKPNIYLNSDYGSTDVPVPSGIGPVGGNIALMR